MCVPHTPPAPALSVAPARTVSPEHLLAQQRLCLHSVLHDTSSTCVFPRLHALRAGAAAGCRFSLHKAWHLSRAR